MSDGRGVIEINGIFVGGEWRAAEDQKLFDVYRPYYRGLYAQVIADGRSQAMLAVDAAAKAFPRSRNRLKPSA
jgi:acyl-CoA reductase-like NAD-dependent aldehyde dehydrogenase